MMERRDLSQLEHPFTALLPPHDVNDMQSSVCKEPIDTVVSTEKAHSSIPYTEKEALEASCVPQVKKRVFQSGIMDFLAVPGKKQAVKQEKSLAKSIEKRRGIQTMDRNGCQIAKKSLGKKEDDIIMSTMNLAPCKLGDYSDFFKPTSAKQRQSINKCITRKSEFLSKHEIEKKNSFKVDLQLEAKLAAEENAQLFAGKSTHPFFSHQKAGLLAFSCNSNFESAFFAPIASSGCLSPATPFHVNQLPESIDCKVECQTRNCTHIWHERRKDRFVLTTGLSVQELGMLLRIPLSGRRRTKSVSQPTTEEIAHEPLENTIFEQLIIFLKELEKDNKHKETGEEDNFSFTEGGLKERLKLFQSCHAKEGFGASSDLTPRPIKSGSISANLLWTDVYQPRILEQVYGNAESVKYLSMWLQSWQTRSMPFLNSFKGDTPHQRIAIGDDCSDEDGGWSGEDSDCSGNSSYDYFLQNVLVLMGPVGCGKTVAIYACAQLHGYTVIEVNSSENRSGPLVKQKFGESMESHRLGKWSADSNVAEELGQDDEFGDNKDRAILLLEDVDVLFEIDRGFIAAVAQVAATAKRPIIMTTSDSKLCIPHNLHARLLEFRSPSTKDLVALAYLVCIAEGFILSPQLLQRIVHVCNHDARKLLNYLQFWCQGNYHSLLNLKRINLEVMKAGEKSGMLSNVKLQEGDPAAVTHLFCFEAQHKLWPVYVPAECQCYVTKSVASKLAELVSMTEKNYGPHQEKKLAQDLVRKRVLLDKRERRMINSNLDVEVDRLMEEDDKETVARESSLSDSPVSDLIGARSMSPSPVVRKMAKRQLAIVLSDSDDDLPSAVQKQPLQEVLHSHVKHEPLSFLASSNTSRDTDSIESASFFKTEKVTLSQSGLHIEPYSINEGAESEILHNKSSQAPTLICPLKDIETSQSVPSNFLSTYEAVDILWSNFRTCSKNKDGLLLSATSKDSLSLVYSLSVLSDNLSACDVMSYRDCCAQDVVRDTFNCNVCENPECCNRLQVCAQIAHKSFQTCIQDSCIVTNSLGEIDDAVSVEDMLLAVNDPFTLGKLATDEQYNQYIHGQATPAWAEQDLQRLQRRSSLQHSLSTEIPPRAYHFFCGASFYECVSYLALLENLKQDQLALGSLHKRTRFYESRKHPWNISQKSMSILQSFVCFGWSLDWKGVEA